MAMVLKLYSQLQHEAPPSQRVDQGPADPLFSVPQLQSSNPTIFPIPFLASQGSLSEKNLHHHKESFVDFSHQFDILLLKKEPLINPLWKNLTTFYF